MHPFVIDANAIHAFQAERVNENPGDAHAALTAIYKDDCIALDDSDLCLQEWLNCAGGTAPYALLDWVGDELVAGRIRLFPLSDNSCRKHLLSVGLPQSDHKWVRLAIGCGGRRIVSGDIDFFDPTKKNASGRIKEAIRKSRSGKCSKQLKKNYNIEIMCLPHVPEEIENINRAA